MNSNTDKLSHSLLLPFDKNPSGKLTECSFRIMQTFVVSEIELSRLTIKRLF